MLAARLSPREISYREENGLGPVLMAVQAPTTPECPPRRSKSRKINVTVRTEHTTTVVPGFAFAGVAAGIKSNGRPDLALAVADEAVPAAAVFTTNLVRAAPVLVAAERIAQGKARAVLVNSGCANACTGAAGLAATHDTTAAVAAALGAPETGVLSASTGVIGVTLAQRQSHRGSSLADELAVGPRRRPLRRGDSHHRPRSQGGPRPRGRLGDVPSSSSGWPRARA